MWPVSIGPVCSRWICGTVGRACLRPHRCAPPGHPSGRYRGEVRIYGRRSSNRARVACWWTAAAVLLVAAGYALRAVVGHSSGGAVPAAVSTDSTKTGVIPTSPTRTTSSATTATTGPVAPPGRPVPILMYHVIESPPASAPYADLYMPPSLFASQMRYLRVQ